MKHNNIFFQCCLCLWDEPLKSLVLLGTNDVTGSRRNYKLFTPFLSSAMFVSRGFSGSGGPKTPRYWKLRNIKNKKCSNATDNNPGDFKVLFIYVMQWILVCVGTARIFLWARQLRKLSFLCQYSTYRLTCLPVKCIKKILSLGHKGCYCFTATCRIVFIFDHFISSLWQCDPIMFYSLIRWGFSWGVVKS